MMKEVQKFAEERLGLPKLAEVADVLRNIPDEPKLRLLRAILFEANRLGGDPDELRAVQGIVAAISQMPQEKIEAVRDIVQGLARLAKLLPKEGLQGLPLRDILDEMKKR